MYFGVGGVVSQPGDRAGSLWGQLARRRATSQGSKITTPICTRISKHKTPKRGHSKPKAAANHLFRVFFFFFFP